MTTKPDVTLLSLNDIDPFLGDGGTRTAIERMRALQSLGSRVLLINFLVDSPRNRYIMDQMIADNRDPVPAAEKSACHSSLAGIPAYHEIVPWGFEQLRTEYPRVIKLMMQKMRESDIHFVFTVDQGYYPLLAAWQSQTPGAHCFHSQPNVVGFARNPFHVNFLRSRVVFTRSEHLRSQLQSETGVDSLVWYGFLDLDSYTYQEAESVAARQPTFDVGFCGGGRAKGNLIVRKLAERMPDLTFLFVGHNRLPEPVGGLSNEKHLGHLSDMKQFYGQIRLLLVPSLHGDAFPRVVMEATANGIPVIANRVGGIPEALGDSGILIDVDLEMEIDLDEVADSYVIEIRRLMGDKTLYRSYRSKAIARAQEFKVEQMREIRAIYDTYILRAGD